MISYIVNWYILLAVFGVFLLLFRDDKNWILKDIQMGYLKKPKIAMFHTLILFLLMPFSIPFSFYHIIKKWF